jgi:hypothetical protein
MGNLSTLTREALRQVENDSIAKRLLRCKQAIKDFERQPNEISIRVCQDLKKVLDSVKNDPEASSEQKTDAHGLVIRVRNLNPRNQKDDDEVSIEELESTNRRSATPDPAKYERPVAPKPKREPDGYDPTFLEGGIDGAIERVIAKGYTPEMPIKQHEAFLQTALGSSRTLDALAADQIYLAIAYNWKQRWNFVLPPMARKLQTAVLSYSNPRGFQIHEPDCLSFVESVDFGSN